MSGGWLHGAACADAANPEIFFPANNAPVTIAAAKAFCARCPVKLECREYALGRDDPGLWGGLTREERRRMRVTPSA